MIAKLKNFFFWLNKIIKITTRRSPHRQQKPRPYDSSFRIKSCREKICNIKMSNTYKIVFNLSELKFENSSNYDAISFSKTFFWKSFDSTQYSHARANRSTHAIKRCVDCNFYSFFFLFRKFKIKIVNINRTIYYYYY